MSEVLAYNHVPVVKHILNHDIMNCTAEGVIGNHLYSGRALGISEPWDIIQLHPELKPLWKDISAHYKRVGLSHSENVIWYLDLKQLGAHIGHAPSVFYFGPNECQYWGDQNWLNTVEYINSKNNFMALAEELGIDVPKTVCFDSVTDISQRDLLNTDYPCYLKAAISVSGVGIYRCETKEELIAAAAKFKDDVPVQIQEEVITETFLNMQYQVTYKDVVRLAASEQILDGFVHQGNTVPARIEPWAAVDAMAYWLKDHGMRGIFAFDVAIVLTKRGIRFPVIECNPRFNGATYPTLIAKKLGITQWRTINFTTKFRSLSEIDIMDLEYDHKCGKGVIIVNWGTVLEGKIVILMAGTAEYLELLTAELKKRLS